MNKLVLTRMERGGAKEIVKRGGIQLDNRVPFFRVLICLRTREVHSRSFAAGLFLLLLLTLSACGKQRSGSESVSNFEPVPITNMVRIKSGTFFRIKHSVTLTQEFWIGKYEVTQDEFWTLMGKNPSYFTNDVNCPVEKLSYLDAKAYCDALTKRERDGGRLPASYSYRLPTEAEWEYACRAGTTNFYSFGDSATNAAEYAWTLENSEEHTHPVGQKRPNPWGLYDMHGNVWEWVLDWYAPYPDRDMTDPIGPPQGKFRVFRGGGWNQEIQYARSANRFGMEPGRGIHFVGFRVVLARTPSSSATMKQ
jgi:hypothetical protein